MIRHVSWRMFQSLLENLKSSQRQSSEEIAKIAKKKKKHSFKRLSKERHKSSSQRFDHMHLPSLSKHCIDALTAAREEGQWQRKPESFLKYVVFLPCSLEIQVKGKGRLENRRNQKETRSLRKWLRNTSSNSTAPTYKHRLWYLLRWKTGRKNVERGIPPLPLPSLIPQIFS